MLNNENVFQVLKESKTLRKEWREGFDDAINAIGEVLIGTMTTKQILDVFIMQGYWSGVLWNIYFNVNDYFTVKARTFGG